MMSSSVRWSIFSLILDDIRVLDFWVLFGWCVVEGFVDVPLVCFTVCEAWLSFCMCLCIECVFVLCCVAEC